MNATAIRQRAPTGTPTPTPILVALAGPGDCRVEGAGGGILDDVDEGKPDELKKEAALKAEEVDGFDARGLGGLKDEASDALLAGNPMVVNGDRGPCKVKLDVSLSHLHGVQQYVLFSHELIAAPPTRRLMRHCCDDRPRTK